MIAPNSEGKLVGRPLSPHLQVYQWPISMALSIIHRVTGVGLAGGTLLLTWWLVAAAGSDAAFDTVQRFVGSVPGFSLMFAWCAALIFHFFSGVRHLLWDFGIGFDAPMYKTSGWAVVFLTGAFITLVWIIGLLLW
ncbi:succinate dehydrogenase, cytochrome b556 subunit [Rhodopila sp.]|uniref:succinate dehydrogenase, cytochrome b556 subunit n=1 Tax=Rhodopila sp. TaxID=2480087 RepID=UPI003D12D6F5